MCGNYDPVDIFFFTMMAASAVCALALAIKLVVSCFKGL